MENENSDDSFDIFGAVKQYCHSSKTGEFSREMIRLQREAFSKEDDESDASPLKIKPTVKSKNKQLRNALKTQACLGNNKPKSISVVEKSNTCVEKTTNENVLVISSEDESVNADIIVPVAQAKPKRGTKKTRAAKTKNNISQADSTSDSLNTVDKLIESLCNNANVTLAAEHNLTRSGRKRRAVRNNRSLNINHLVSGNPKHNRPIKPKPTTVISEAIDLLSDDEDTDKKADKNFNDSMKSSCELDNQLLNLKLKWKSNYEKIPHRKFQKFKDLMEFLAKRENTQVENIVLVLNDKIIQPNETPESINYKIFDFISGRVMVGGLSNSTVGTAKKDPNEIELNVQSDKWKKPLVFSLKKTQLLKILYIKCSEEIKVPYEKIQLKFDGELLGLTETPSSLDLEGGEVIDCRILN